MAKILIIDDDKALSSVFETALTNSKFNVVLAHDGNTGIDKAKTEKPDLILLDQVLPDIPGNDVLKTLKEEAATKEIPVAMLSNFGQNELVKKAIDMGAVEYILKYQIDPKDLVNKVTALTGQQTS